MPMRIFKFEEGELFGRRRKNNLLALTFSGHPKNYGWLTKDRLQIEDV